MGGEKIIDFEEEYANIQEEYVNIPLGVASFVDIDPSFTQNTITDEIIIETRTQQDETAQNKNSETGAGHSGPHEVFEDAVVGQIVLDNAGNPQKSL